MEGNLKYSVEYIEDCIARDIKNRNLAKNGWCVRGSKIKKYFLKPGTRYESKERPGTDN